MNETITPIKRALISVSDKSHLIELAQGLHQLDIEIISTGGTSQLLRDANIPTKDIADLTQFPEMMDGRVKTLHPRVHGGILGLRDAHHAIATSHDIPWIDLVVVNLYPFAETIRKPNVTLDDAVENIDIGGPAMLRSAAKNMGWVGVVVDPADYHVILTELKTQSGLTFPTRKRLATKAFQHTAQYDGLIYHYLSHDNALNFAVEKSFELRYGENPHQSASAYRLQHHAEGVLSAIQHQGKQLSYNNIADADAAYNCVCEFTEPACVIVKHANPCGAATADSIAAAFHQAFAADSLSAFGGIVALNQVCDAETAKAIAAIFIEVVIAPGYSQEALAILANKPNIRVLELKKIDNHVLDIKFIAGGLLVQDKDDSVLEKNQLKIVTTLQPNAKEIETMQFAWQVLKYIKSNAILIAKDNHTVGIGAGQVSRIDAVDIAVRKAGEHIGGSILASDAFFPFRDSIDRLKETGVSAIIQPGGSIRDEEVIAACDEHGIAMVFAGIRCFKH
jgi:phosphoribosylaminoimidazolecarboxamide formyltransferase/IMP cyclohydrolase